MNKIQKSKDRYWKIVTQSAIELFGMPESDAYEGAKILRRDLDSLTKSKIPLYYHREAIHIAASMAGLERDGSVEKSRKAYDAKIKRLWGKYQKIRNKIN